MRPRRIADPRASSASAPWSATPRLREFSPLHASRLEVSRAAGSGSGEALAGRALHQAVNPHPRRAPASLAAPGPDRAATSSICTTSSPRATSTLARTDAGARGAASSAGCAGAGNPNTRGASAGAGITPAPSASSRCGPRLGPAYTLPGTANTGRPCARAYRAVISAPLSRSPSTTITARASPLISRLRRANCRRSGCAPMGASDTSAPRACIASIKDRCSGGYTTSTPPASTPTVTPPARSAPAWAAPSIPRARPLTTTAPDAPRDSPRLPATPRPYGVARRVPTTATAGPAPPGHRPRTYTTGGASRRSRHAGGYPSSSHVRTRAPAASARRSTRSTSTAPRPDAINAATRVPMPPTDPRASAGAPHASRADPNARIKPAMRTGPSPGVRLNAIRHRRSPASKDSIPRCLALSNNAAGATAPRLPHEHTRVDGRGAAVVQQHTGAFADRGARCHHVVEQQDVGAAQHPRPKPQRKHPVHGAPPRGLGPPALGGDGPCLREERRREIVARHAAAEIRQRLEVDRGERMPPASPHRRGMKRHGHEHVVVSHGGGIRNPPDEEPREERRRRRAAAILGGQHERARRAAMVPEDAPGRTDPQPPAPAPQAGTASPGAALGAPTARAVGNRIQRRRDARRRNRITPAAPP